MQGDLVPPFEGPWVRIPSDPTLDNGDLEETFTASLCQSIWSHVWKHNFNKIKMYLSECLAVVIIPTASENKIWVYIVSVFHINQSLGPPFCGGPGGLIGKIHDFCVCKANWCHLLKVPGSIPTWSNPDSGRLRKNIHSSPVPVHMKSCVQV